MKKIHVLFILGILFCTACVNKPIMPPIKYDKPIDFHIGKNAYLNWEVGKQYSSTVPVRAQPNSGLIGVAVTAAVASASRANNPSYYAMSYGKAEQAIFMTSLRDTLEQNQVFKQVQLVTDSKQKVGLKDVLISIYFKTSRVLSPERGYKIILTVDMSIAAAGKTPFKRTYLVESNVEGFNKTFMDQQIDVSSKLLDKIIGGIKEWQRN